MATTTFFLPSTAYRGRNPRVRIPATDPGLPDEGWIPGAISTGPELQWFLNILEPLLTVVQMSGHAIPEIAIVCNDSGQYSGGLRYETESSRVALIDEAAAEDEFRSLESGIFAYIAFRGIYVFNPNGVETQPAPLVTLIERVSGKTEFWLKVKGVSGDDFRANFQAPAIALTNKILGMLSQEVGILRCYIPVNWILPENVDDSAGALMSICNFLDLKGELADLLCDLGPFTNSSTDPSRPYKFVTLFERLKDRAKENGAESKDAEWLLTALRTTLANSGQGQDDYRDVSLTATLLELHSRGVVKIIGDVVADDRPTEDEISEILAQPWALSSRDVERLLAYLKLGLLDQSDEVAARISEEYQYHEDPALRGDIVEGLISICEAAPIAGPNGAAPPPPRTFEAFLASFNPIFNAVVWEERDHQQIGEFTRDLWEQWRTRLADINLADKFHYGAAILFLNCADLNVQLEALEALTLFYVPVVVDASQGLWRHPDVRPSSYTAPDGWSEWLLAMMCDCFYRTTELATNQPRDQIHEALRALVGAGVFHAHAVTMEDVNDAYGELLGTAVDDAASGSAMKEYGHLTQALARRYTDETFARRLSIPKVTGALFRLIESDREGIQTQLRVLHSQAAINANGDHAVAVDRGFKQGEWYMNDATQAYLGTLDVTARSQFEQDELGVLSIFDPGTTGRCMAYSNNTALISGVYEYLNSIEDEQIQAKVVETTAGLDGWEPSNTEIRNIAKMTRARFKVFEPFTYEHAFFWLNGSIDVAVARHLADLGLYTEREIPDLITQLKRLRDAGGRSLSNVAAAVSGSIALYQLWEKGFSQDPSSIGLINDVATGAVAGTELMAIVVATYTTQPSLILSSDLFVELSAWMGRISPFVSVITNGYAASNEFINGNFVPAALFLGAAVLNGYLAVEILAGAASVSAIPGGLVIALVAAALVVAVMVWKWFEEEEYLQTVQGYEALWDEIVAMTPPLVIEIQEIMVESGDLVTSEDLLATVLVAAGDDLDVPDWQPDHGEFVMVEAGGRTHLASRIPGTIMSFNLSIGQRLSANDTALTISPFLEYITTTTRSGTVGQIFANIGDVVEKNGDLLEYLDSSGTPRTVKAAHGGRVYEILKPGAQFLRNAVLSRLRLDDLDVIVEGVR